MAIIIFYFRDLRPNITAPAGTTVVNATGKYVMPG